MCSAPLDCPNLAFGLHALMWRSTVQVVSINGTTTEGFGSDRVAALLRGKSGTPVTVRFARRTSQVPGVPGRPEQVPQVSSSHMCFAGSRLVMRESDSMASALLHAAGTTAGRCWIRLDALHVSL